MNPPSMTDQRETLDLERQNLAKEYARIKRRLFVFELGLSVVYVLVWVFSGLSPWLRDQIYAVTQATWLAVPLFALRPNRAEGEKEERP